MAQIRYVLNEEEKMETKNKKIDRQISLALILIPLMFWGQEKKNFLIIDHTDKEPIASVVVQLLDKDGEIVSYAISEENGQASLTIKKEGKTVVFSLMGYAKMEVEVSSFTEKINKVEMQQKAQQLQEVIVKIAPIEKKKDTIAYNVGEFKTEQDKYIEDVIEKLPGISISEQGKIYYNREPIAQLFIEGQDMLGGRYNQATRNIPADKVKEVQVIENHQEIKMLKDKVFSDKVALNIKLKDKAKNAPFGEASVASGVPPLLWRGKIFGMKLGKDNQQMINIKSNNTADDLESENAEMTSYRMWDLWESPPQGVMKIESPHPPLAPKRFLNNKAATFGVNTLFRTSKEASMRVNVLGYVDRKTTQSGFEATYAGIIPVNIEENSEFVKKIKDYKAEVKYEENTDKKYALNLLKINVGKTTDRADLKLNQHTIRQRAQTKPFEVENTNFYSFGTKESIYSIKTFVRYAQRDEEFESQREIGGEIDGDCLANKSLLAKAMFVNSVDVLGQRINLKTIGQAGENTYKRESGDSKLRKLGIYAFPEIVVSKNRFHLSIDLNLGVRDLRLTLAKDNGQEKSTFFSFTPQASGKYEISHKWETTFEAGWSKEPEEQPFYSPFPIGLNYRSIYHSSNKIWITERAKAGAGVAYKDLVDMLFVRINTEWERRYRDYAEDNTYGWEMQKNGYVEKENTIGSFAVRASADKTFIDHGISLSLGGGYAREKRTVGQNGDFFENKEQDIYINAGTRYEKLKFVTLTYAFVGKISYNKNKYTKGKKAMEGYVNQLRSSFIVSPVVISFTASNTTGELLEGGFKNTTFSDLDIRWKKSKRLELFLNLSNIFDNDIYQVSQISGANKQRQWVRLRPRELIAGCSFMF